MIALYAALRWWSHAWLSSHVWVALMLLLRCCWACTCAEGIGLLCTLTISCNPQLSSCSQKNGTNWVLLWQCCRWHKSQWLIRPSWALILFHPLPMLHKMKKNRVILTIHPLNLGAEFFPWSWIRIWSLFWFFGAIELSKLVWVYSSVRLLWGYSIPGLAREKFHSQLLSYALVGKIQFDVLFPCSE